MNGPLITIAVQCHNFQRRLCWMLSSLLQQTSRDDLAVDVASMAGNGSPTTTDLVRRFGAAGMNIHERLYVEPLGFERRGLVRNHQLRTCATRWIWFADADHVYHPEYVWALLTELESAEKYRSGKVITAGRMSLPCNPSVVVDAMVEAEIQNEARIVPDAYARANRINPKVRRGAPGAGNMQIVRTEAESHGRVYVDDVACRDGRWSTGIQRARSDIQFRHRCGGRIVLPDYFTTHQIHLNHKRDNEVGYHLDDQR